MKLSLASPLLLILAGCISQPQPPTPQLPPAPPGIESKRPTAKALVAAAPAPVPTVTLAWNKNPEPTVNSYLLYQGVKSRTYTNVTPTTATNLTVAYVPNLTNYFAVTAFTGILESGYSSEVFFSSPPTNPPAVVVVIRSLVDGSINNSTWQLLWTSPPAYFTNTIDPAVVKFWRTRAQIDWFNVP